MHDIDRKMASRLLKVTPRTVDRYIAKNRLSIEKRDGRIWLNKKEILKLRDQKRVDKPIDMSTTRMSIDKIDVIPVDMSTDNDQDVSTSDPKESFQEAQKSPRGPRQRVDNSPEEGVYRKLFEELQQDLKQKQDRLEMANYRVGQLEARIKDTIPLLDYNRDLAKERQEKEQLHKNLDAEHVQAEKTLLILKEERMNKIIYLVLLFILLLLQPLWFFFR